MGHAVHNGSARRTRLGSFGSASRAPSRALKRRLVFVALVSAALTAAALNSLPLLALIGAVAALVNAHSRAKRRAAKAALLATTSAVLWVGMNNVLEVDARAAYCAPLIAAALASPVLSLPLLATATPTPKARRTNDTTSCERPSGARSMYQSLYQWKTKRPRRGLF
jgi:hypothetical protein